MQSLIFGRSLFSNSVRSFPEKPSARKKKTMNKEKIQPLQLSEESIRNWEE
jgi:hypothetical protein